MFNGIITNTGTIHKISKHKNDCVIDIKSKINFKKNEIGSSVSCSGACLTLEKFNKNIYSFYLSKETLKKTIFKFSKKKDIINIEKSLLYGDSVSGHFVQGHVDTIALVDKILVLGKSWLVNFKINNKYKKYLVHKGSITINGVSLTIVKILKSGFQISIVPHTLKLTNLVLLNKKDFVNVEFDVLGKYIRNFINAKK